VGGFLGGEISTREIMIQTRRLDIVADIRAIVNMPLREADKREIVSVLGEGDPNALLLQSLTNSQGEKWIASQDGEDFAIFGVEPTNEPMLGLVAAVGTDKISEGGVAMAAWGIKAVDMCHEYYPILHNVVDERNDVHIKWLKAMKFQFSGIAYKINDVNFLHFGRVRI
jgi:hypothetical protein